jgi:hypothetical protein
MGGSHCSADWKKWKVSIVPQMKFFILPQFRSKILFSHCSAAKKKFPQFRSKIFIFPQFRNKNFMFPQFRSIT